MAINVTELWAYYRLMRLIRRFDERVMELFGQGWIHGTAHACVGQEATAVGACAPLRPDDCVTSTHRGHGHLLAKGGDPKRLMAELFGKATGYSKGRGGSQHVAAYDLGFLGSNGITAGGLPIGTGAALALRMQGTDRVVVSFVGDGGVGQGAFHEALNLGALWKLPIVYVCENNLYAMGTAFARASPVPQVVDRAAAYGMPGVRVDGNDVLAVKEAVGAAVERARGGGGPTLIEAQTYRYLGHSKGDVDRPYRSREEEEEWRRRDPLDRCRRWLQEAAAWTEAAEAQLQAEVEAEIEAAVRFARESPDPDPETVQEGVFA
jgi:TPP-dependent pyruvate/acetoin dehydrogenase alpha subunit